MNKRKIIILTTILLILVLCVEFYFRTRLGLANAPLYYSSEHYEYMALSNQHGKRFGNQFSYNSFSHRSEEPDSSKTIILGMGDSVIFGGVLTDQDSIATSIVSREMEGVQMLNISAGSWGPDNVAAYLNQYGTFSAKAMVLLVSSHDAHDIMDFTPVVGVHPSYPNKQYRLAIGELLHRYVLPRMKRTFKMRESSTEQLDPDKQVLVGIDMVKDAFNPGFDQLLQVAKSQNIPLALILHPDLDELAANQYKESGVSIINWAHENKVPLFKQLDYSFSPSDYRDGIHTNAQGQRKQAAIMMEAIEKLNVK